MKRIYHDLRVYPRELELHRRLREFLDDNDAKVPKYEIGAVKAV